MAGHLVGSGVRVELQLAPVYRTCCQMRFKSTVDHISLLTALLQSAEKMGKRAILKLTDQTVFLICAKGEGDVQMWSSVQFSILFVNL
jgi:HUS1 checkpoint protein